MANRRMLETVLDLYMRQKAQRESQQRAHEMQLAEQENQYRLQGLNQSAESRRRAEEALWGKAVSDPAVARQLRKSGVTQLAGKPLDTLGVEERSAAPELEQIAKTPSVGQLPGLGALGNQYVQGKRDAWSPITDLTELGAITAAHGNQEQALKRNTAPVKISYPDEKGNMMDEYRNPWDIQDQPFMREPTAQQVGTKKGEEWVAEDKVAGPGRTSREQKNAYAQGYGTAAGRAKGELDNLSALTKVAEQLAQARGQGKPTPNVSPFMLNISKDIVRLATALNQTDSQWSARIGGARNAAANMGIPIGDYETLVDPDTGLPMKNVKGRAMTRAEGAAELERLRDGATSTLLRVLGRQGPATEGDEKRTKGLIPAGNLTRTESENAVAYFDKLMQAAQQVGDRYPPIESLPLEQQEAEVARRIEEAKQLANGGGTDPDAVSGMEKLNARSRR